MEWVDYWPCQLLPMWLRLQFHFPRRGSISDTLTLIWMDRFKRDFPFHKEPYEEELDVQHPKHSFNQPKIGQICTLLHLHMPPRLSSMITREPLRYNLIDLHLHMLFMHEEKSLCREEPSILPNCYSCPVLDPRITYSPWEYLLLPTFLLDLIYKITSIQEEYILKSINVSHLYKDV